MLYKEKSAGEQKGQKEDGREREKEEKDSQYHNTPHGSTDKSGNLNIYLLYTYHSTYLSTTLYTDIPFSILAIYLFSPNMLSNMFNLFPLHLLIMGSVN